MGIQSIEDSKARDRIRIPKCPPSDTIVDKVWTGILISSFVVVVLLIVGASFDAFDFRVIRGALTIPTLIAGLCTLGIIRLAMEVAGQWGFEKLSKTNSIFRNAVYVLLGLLAFGIGLVLRLLIQSLY